MNRLDNFKNNFPDFGYHGLYPRLQTHRKTKDFEDFGKCVIESRNLGTNEVKSWTSSSKANLPQSENSRHLSFINAFGNFSITYKNKRECLLFHPVHVNAKWTGDSEQYLHIQMRRLNSKFVFKNNQLKF